MTQRDVLLRLERIATYQWLDLGPLGRRLVLRCLRALEADVAEEERSALSSQLLVRPGESSIEGRLQE